ncbi:DUF4920 domain-containing protein (plasmid) [Pseudoalteromonas sp. T1lg65]|uniref:DUF4920 domain-containing protein n=1 Tax=Pseudoalteromonas sp. T1lg65 TaxID=2077101 RepID=UPI003F795F45
MKDSIKLTALSLAIFSKFSFATPLEFAGGADMSKLVDAQMVLDDIEAYQGRVITLKGEVTKVCRKKGCWMNLNVHQGYEITVKVNDGDMVFPMASIGREAFATGMLQKMQLSLEETKAHLAHKAQENGEAIDVTLITSPITVFQLRPNAVTISN